MRVEGRRRVIRASPFFTRRAHGLQRTPRVHGLHGSTAARQPRRLGRHSVNLWQIGGWRAVEAWRQQGKRARRVGQREGGWARGHVKGQFVENFFSSIS